MGWLLPRSFASSPAEATSALRAAGMALPAMIAAAPCAAIVIRRLGAGWPVLLAGLLIIALADVGAEVVRSVPLLALDRTLRGIGAGLALPAVLVTARMAHPHGSNRDDGPFSRFGHAAIWAFVMVASLAAAPLLVRERLTGGDWRAALQPYPWLTGVALVCAAAYLPLAGSGGIRRRDDLLDRTQLALVAAPLMALAVLLVAVSYQTRVAVAATAVSELIVLGTLTAKLARNAARDTFPIVCAVTGFTLMPAAALAPLARGLVPMPAVVAAIVALAAVLAIALIRSLRRATVAAVLTGTPILIAAVGAGYLAAAVHG